MRAPLPTIECRGDPRAMGAAQGESQRAAVHEALELRHISVRRRLPTSLRPWVSGRVLGSGMGREIVRHYTHLSERMAGIAAGAGVPAASLVELFVRSARGEWPDAPPADAAAAAAREGQHDGARVVRALPAVSREAPWRLRRSTPEVGFASVELTLPWLAASVGGVNAAGVAAALAPRPPDPRRVRGPAPSALLLVQECLQRFADVAACLDWCQKRPVSGDLAIVLADAAGEIAAVDVRGSERSLLRSADGILVEGGPEATQPALRLGWTKAQQGDALDAALSAALREAGFPGDALLVVLEPAQRTLGLATLDAPDEAVTERVEIDSDS